MGSWEAVVHAGVAALWLLWLLGSAPTGRERAIRLGGVSLVVVVAWVGLLVADPFGVPLDELVPVREGSTDIQVRVARAEGVSGGSAYPHVVLPLLAGPLRTLDAVAMVNRALALASWTGLALLGWRMSRHGFLVLAGVVALWVSPLGGVGAMSSEPSAAIWVLGLMGCTALHGAWHGQGRWSAVAALAVGSLAGVMALYRLEPAAILVGALLQAGASRVGWGAWVQRTVAAHRVWAGALAAGLLLGSGLAYPWVKDLVGGAGRAGWVVQALYPWDDAAWTLPLILASMVSPVLVGLAALGLLRTPSASLGLGWSWLLVLRVEHAAAHGGMRGTGDWAWPMEMLRYASYGAPVLLWLAWVGWLGLASRIPWTTQNRRGLGVGLAIAVLVLPAMPQVWPARVADEVLGPAWSHERGVPMVLDNQVEARALLLGMRERPMCGFVAPGEVQADGRRTWFAWRSTWGDITRNERRMVTSRDVSTVEEAADLVPGHPDCVLLYTGLSCARSDGDCEAFTQGLVPWWTRTTPSAPQTHPDHGWTTDGPWSQTWWVVRGAATP